ncbi:SDR family NAD(P)-dependent oxidoreductase [Saccharomonospora sp. NPDC046836]|uniref:SDR family NAD(P)-dependent oxidoreductase n=1 Tax=Saccharomonospora sp. NPDC046836 TaxID=3156921 RepID=UPI0033CFCB8E
MRLDGTAAVVTGGTSGLGLATAQRLLRAGAAVVLVGRDERRGRELAAELGGRAQFAPADTRCAEAVAAALDLAATQGPLRTVVNCAGIVASARTVDRNGVAASLEAFNELIQVNLVGTFNVLRLAAERMAGNTVDAGERGVVINTASVAAFEGQQGQAAYAAAKAGIVGMTLPTARDLAPALIRVVTIAPGLFDTPMAAAVPERLRTSLVEQTAHPKRMGMPDEFAALVQHVVENPMLNAEVIRLDGAARVAAGSGGSPGNTASR